MTVMELQCVTTHMAASVAFVNQDTATMDPTALVCNRICLKASQTYTSNCFVRFSVTYLSGFNFNFSRLP